MGLLLYVISITLHWPARELNDFLNGFCGTVILAWMSPLSPLCHPLSEQFLSLPVTDAASGNKRPAASLSLSENGGDTLFNEAM